MTKLLLLAAFALVLSGCGSMSYEFGEPCPAEFEAYRHYCGGIVHPIKMPLCDEAAKRYKKCLKEAPTL